MLEILIALPTHPKDRSENEDPNDMKLRRDVASSPPRKQDRNDKAEPILLNPNTLSLDAYNGWERNELDDAM
jgi:hypothetical protein